MRDNLEISTEKHFPKKEIPQKTLLHYLKVDLIQLFIEQNLHQPYLLPDR